MSKKAIISLLAIGLSSVPLFAQAANQLTIDNQTNYFSTCKIHTSQGPMCSSKLPGGIGVTSPHTKKSIPMVIVANVCGSNATDCTADLYMDADCNGVPISTAVFDMKKGLKSHTPPINGFVITGSGFDLQISGPKK